MSPRASIVIPAHNEEGRIRPLLETLSDASLTRSYDIYVVCNGCTDRTSTVAREYPGLRVVEVADAGKYHALNEGDRLANDVFPRLYCDADVLISPASIDALVDALNEPEIRAGGPTVRYGAETSSWGVKMYYRALASPIMTSWQDSHLSGRGLYGASREARHCFDTFPPLVADDLFFDSRFSASQKMVVPSSVVTIWVPPTLRALIRSEVRVSQGNRQFYAEGRASSERDVRPPRGVRFELKITRRLRTLHGWSRQLRWLDVATLAVLLYVKATARTAVIARESRAKKVEWR